MKNYILLFYSFIFILSSSFNSINIEKQNSINKVQSRVLSLELFIEKINRKEIERNKKKKEIRKILDSTVTLTNPKDKLHYLESNLFKINANQQEKSQIIKNITNSMVRLGKKANSKDEFIDIFTINYHIWVFFKKNEVNFGYNCPAFLTTLKKILKSNIDKKKINQELLNEAILELRKIYYVPYEIPKNIELKPIFFCDQQIIPSFYWNNSQSSLNNLIESYLKNLFFRAEPDCDYDHLKFIKNYGDEISAPFLKIPISMMGNEFQPHIKNLIRYTGKRNVIIYLELYMKADLITAYTILDSAGLNHKWSHE